MYVILTFIFFLLYVCYNHDGMKDGYIKVGTASPYVCVADTRANAERIIAIAREAGVKRLLVGHFSARYDNEDLLLEQARAVFPETMLAKETLCVPI